MMPLRTNIELNFMNRMYVKLMARPIPMFRPRPPRFLREDSETAMTVSTKAEKGIARRLFFSIRAFLTASSPRIFWTWIKSSRSLPDIDSTAFLRR